ncbi:MAG: HEAT repeat domain-containing protein, partial [Thermoanaerobaculia bacterium]
VRRDAMTKFAQAGHREVQQVLPVALAAFKDSDPEVRYYAVVALMVAASTDVKNATRLGQAAPALIQRLGDSDSLVRQEAANALALILPAPPRAAASPLLGLLRDPDRAVQSAALGALARLGPVTPKVSQGVRELLDAEDASLRAEAANVLGELGGSDPDNVWALINALNDPDAFVRQHGARALGKLGKSASVAIPHLQELVEKAGEDPIVRDYARHALHSIQDQ